ncbi:MAG: hypothetical protein KJI69_04295 [Patescibacteria group bacterium]|nr:hypothetical protein [Patescibacteria group bacterium]
MKNEQLSAKDQLYYVFVGVGIGVVYVIFFMLITGVNLDFIIPIPMAFGQVQPFELQLEQIRNPEACTRKVLQSSGAYIPFTLKVFYDTTQDRSWDVISKAETFPVAQQTAQVATFFTQEIDQYEVHLEVNYDRPQKRQAYIEVLSEGRTVTSWQEKFDDQKFCMTFFINTNEPPTFPTREELIGDLLTNVDKIPEMITSFNINTITWNTSISYMWTLIFASIVLSVLTLLGTSIVNRNVKSKMKDMDDAVDLVDKSARKIDEMKEPFDQIIKNQNKILKNQDLILAKSPVPIVEPEKKSKLSQIFKKKTEDKIEVSEHVTKGLKPKGKSRWSFLKRNKDEDEEYEEEKDDEDNENVYDNGKIEVPPKEVKEESAKLVEVIEKLKPDVEKDVEEELEGGFIQTSKEEKVPPTPPPKEEMLPPVEQKPSRFKEILRAIDFKNNAFKEGEFDKFTYNELNNMYGWIVHYKKRKLMLKEWEMLPKVVREKQDVAERVIYYAIFQKMDKRLKND